MATNLNFLTDDELREMRTLAVKRREHLDNIIKKIDSQLTSADFFESQESASMTASKDSSQEKSYGDMSVKELIIVTMKFVGVPLSNLEIRKHIQRKANKDISGNGVRAQLKKGEHTIFKRKGEGKFTKWMLIEQN